MRNRGDRHQDETAAPAEIHPQERIRDLISTYTSDGRLMKP